MKRFIFLLALSIVIASCQSGKPKSKAKEKCDTCPSLSNEGKIDKPFKKKKK